jgi:protein arginine kinase activator
MHKGTRHVGKRPHTVQTEAEIANKLKSLQKQLEKAIADENFEGAAQIRDEIKQAKAKTAEAA